MKKMYYKYKILINGFNTKEKYNIDGFELKNAYFKKEIFNKSYKKDEDGIHLNMDLYLISCLNDYKELSYSYFESRDFFEIEVSNKTSKTNLNKVISKNKIITDTVLNLEFKIRLIFNIPVLFQSINVEFYDENKQYLGTYQLNRPISFWNRLNYIISAGEVNNNSRFGFEVNCMKNTNNNYFNRAIEFYNDSFDSDKITNRYLLIFSSLEAIFNLDGDEIAEKISTYSAKLLAEDNKQIYELIHKEIKRLYNKRCKYIHGAKRNNIKEEDEILIRRYVRKIIITYWALIMKTNMTSKQILDYLDGNEKLPLETRLLISSLNANSFYEQQHKNVEIIETEIGRLIPNETKQVLFSKCDLQENKNLNCVKNAEEEQSKKLST